MIKLFCDFIRNFEFSTVFMKFSVDVANSSLKYRFKQKKEISKNCLTNGGSISEGIFSFKMKNLN